MAAFTREDIKKDTYEIVDTAMRQTIDQISEVIRDLILVMEERFAVVDEKFAEIEQQNNHTHDMLRSDRARLDDHGGRIVGLEKKVGLKA